MSPTPNMQQLPLSQCLDQLRTASLLVLQHEELNDEAKSFIGELIQTILHQAGQFDSTGNHSQPETGGDSARLFPVVRLSPPGTPISTYQVEVNSETGAILVSNHSTGKNVTCSAEDLINWTRR